MKSRRNVELIASIVLFVAGMGLSSLALYLCMPSVKSLIVDGVGIDDSTWVTCVVIAYILGMIVAGIALYRVVSKKCEVRELTMLEMAKEGLEEKNRKLMADVRNSMASKPVFSQPIVRTVVETPKGVYLVPDALFNRIMRYLYTKSSSEEIMALYQDMDKIYKSR